MLYLAQVQKKGFLGKPAVRLLASQKSENNWVIVTEEKVVECPQATTFSEGLLVLADVNNNRPIVIKDATDWLVDLVKKYLTEDATSPFWQAEKERAEQWRQSLTLQSQDLGRRAIEIEALREKNQVLADELKTEKKEIDQMTRSLNMKRQEIERLDGEFKERERKAREILSAQMQEVKRQIEETERLRSRNKLLEEELQQLKSQQLEKVSRWEREPEPLDPFQT